jgi:nitronate monooxygenase
VNLETSFTRHARVRWPIIGGAMYPCSNPELVGAVSRAGALGIVQPITLTYVHKLDFRAGLKKVQGLAGGNPVGVNLLIEKSSKAYLERNREWLKIALEEGVRFFITALGDPRWVVDIAKAQGAVVYHDVTERRWAEKALDGGVDGLICVNNRAGGHAGTLSPEQLVKDLKSLGVPLVCAGGIGSPKGFTDALALGYAGVQLGTRMIATTECDAHKDYKDAIVRAKAKDIVMTPKITGVPVSVIKTEYIEKMGLEAGPLMQLLLTHARTKHLTRMAFSLKSIWQLKRSLKHGSAYKDFWQAGKSVEDIGAVEPVQAIVERFVAAGLRA